MRAKLFASPAPATATAGASASTVRGDLDGDRRSDLLLTRPGSGVLSFWSMSGPQVTRRTSAFSFGDGTPLAEGDFNGDGRSDVLWSEGRALLLSDGAGGFTIANPPSPQGGWRVFGAGDVDGDGKADMLLQYDTSLFAYWIMDGANVVRYSPPFDRPQGATLVARGDFNGDRKLDLVWQTGRALTMWLGDGNGFTSRPVRDVAEGWTVWGNGDIDGDGRDDLLLTQAARRYLAYWVMDGATPSRYSGIFRLPGEEPLGRRFGPITVGDYNGDGRLDIVHARDTGQQLVMWLGDGTGFVEYPLPAHDPDWRVERVFGRDGAPVRPYAPGDADGDGKADLLTFDTFATYDPARQRYYSTWGGEFEPLATGDFDGDARRDLVLERKDQVTGMRRTFVTLSNYASNEVEIPTPAVGWQIIGAGDIDGDGRSDILLGESVQGLFEGVSSDAYRSPSMGGFAYWLMDHAAVTRYSIGFRTDPQAPRLAARGDFNGDAKLDLVWSSGVTAADQRLQMWLGDGAGFAVTSMQAPIADWRVFDSGDVDGDGRGDLFLKSEGGIAYWLMDATQVREYSPGLVIPVPQVIRDFTGDGRADLIELENDSCRTPASVFLHVSGGRTFNRIYYGSVGYSSAACFFYLGPMAFPR